MNARLASAAGHDPDAGFTLVEVVVAISLIMIVMTGTLGFFMSGVCASADREWKSSSKNQEPRSVRRRSS